jgi:LysR family transcriptional regulator, regulator for genes of the gallate degradation pathway
MAKSIDERAAAPETFPVPNIRHLRVLEAVARNASISRAAAEVGLSQPAVTQAIAKMETIVGRTLFDRRQNGSHQTEVGDVFLNRVRRFLDQTDQAVRDLHPPDGARGCERHVTSTQVRCLLAIARSSSFAQAARTIGISTASLHRAARELEAAVRKPLYRASRNGLSLSPAGVELARRLGLAVREIQAADDDLLFLDGVAGGRMAIGTLPMSGAYLIGAAIADLTSHFPEARVSVINAPYGILLQSLRTGAVDLVFGVLRRPEWATDIVEEALFHDPYCIVGRAGHPLASREGITTDDLLAYDWIVPGEGTPRRRQYEAIFEGHARRPSISIETSSLSTIRSVLTCSDRLALVNRQEVETEERSRLLTVLPWTSDALPMAKGVTTRADWLPTPIQRRFLDILRVHAIGAGRADATQAGPARSAVQQELMAAGGL